MLEFEPPARASSGSEPWIGRPKPPGRAARRDVTTEERDAAAAGASGERRCACADEHVFRREGDYWSVVFEGIPSACGT